MTGVKRLWRCMAVMLTLALAPVSIAPAYAEPLTLTIMSTWSSDSMNSNVGDRVARRAIERLQAAHPELTIREEVLAHDFYEDKLKTLMATNALPDIFMSLPGLLSAMYANGLILDLRPYVEADSQWRERMLPGCFGDFTFGGRWLAVPGGNVISSIVIYNADVLRVCGIDGFPRTMEDFETACLSIRERGYIPIACGNKAGYMLPSQVFPSIMWKHVDTAWYESLVNGTGARFTDLQMTAAYARLKRLIDDGAFNEDMNSCDERLAYEYYYDGRAAMIVGGLWPVGYVSENAQPDVLAASDVAIMPPLADKPENALYVPGGQGWGNALSSSLEGARLTLALELLKHFSDPDLQAMLASEGSLPVAQTDEYDASDQSALMRRVHALLAEAVIVPNDAIQLNANYVTAAEDAFQALTLGSISPEEMGALLQSAYEEGLVG